MLTAHLRSNVVNEPVDSSARPWDAGHEWLWRRMRIFRGAAVVLPLLGLAIGYTVGHRSKSSATSQIATESARASGISERSTDVSSRAASDGQFLAAGAGPRLTLDDRPSRGAANAAITIVEFSDFQCPFCLQHERDVVPVLLDPKGKYGATVRYVIKSLPLDEHPLARGAAEAAECAQAQGKYWEYHDVLFAHQDQLDARALKAHGRAVGLDGDRFDRCIDRREGAAIVDRDMQEAANLGIKGTPTFFVNGLRIPGAQPLALFATVIDRILAGQPVQLTEH